MRTFLEELKQQRWDDHRYYHHSRINQTLHLISATSFVIAYVVLLWDPAVAALIGWLVAMTTRQSGHFFFEPKGYDHLNRATHEHKEEIKVGYNLFRKAVLMGVWALIPLALLVKPDLFGLVAPHAGFVDFALNTGLLWFWLGVVGLLFRTVQLVFVRDPLTGLVWASKILTDPFHDIKLYHKAPACLLRRELIDPRYWSGEPEEAPAR
ncbi:Mpo1-like protein [Sphingosinicella sp. CPCC 101087]|uniref:Mpo1-like protein n=1 Tax=Sphingosinicella sp. CPCC 101087 TaxID=2497754 RepID=UPI00101B613E|nr:Mpo1-like protein [Sphingosinicella sp. CPCC 101087]